MDATELRPESENHRITATELRPEGSMNCGRKELRIAAGTQHTLRPKSTSSYAAVFRHMYEKASDLSEWFAPPIVFSDFEDAIHAAVRQEIPLSRLRGCRFYLGQIWWRHIQALGLTKTYKSATEDSENVFWHVISPPRRSAGILDGRFDTA